MTKEEFKKFLENYEIQMQLKKIFDKILSYELPYVEWEYKIEYIAFFPPHFEGKEDAWQVELLPREERAQYGDQWWQKAVAVELNKFGAQGWAATYISPSLAEGKTLDGFVLLRRIKRKN